MAKPADEEAGEAAPIGDMPAYEFSEAAFSIVSPAEEAAIREHTAGQRVDRCLRLIMAIALTVLFLCLNGIVVWMVGCAVRHDLETLGAKVITPVATCAGHLSSSTICCAAVVLPTCRGPTMT